MNLVTDGPDGTKEEMQVNLDNAELVKCKQCGCDLFDQFLRFKKISAIVSPTGQAELAGINALVCKECGTELSKEDLN